MIHPNAPVICTTTAHPCDHGNSRRPQPVVGRVYRIARVEYGACDHCGAVHLGVAPVSPDLGTGLWPQVWFRTLRDNEASAHAAWAEMLAARPVLDTRRHSRELVR